VRQTALITGATAGIGNAFARRLAADGYDLVIVARDAERLTKTAGELTERHGVTVAPLPADLSTEDGIASVEARLADGSAPVDLLVNNAGFSLPRPFLRSVLADEERMLQVNVHAVMRLTRTVLPAMVSRRHGSVLNVSSVAGFGVTMPGATYGATKAWVTSFSQSMDAGVRRFGVRVMALCPGYTKTEFHQRQGIDITKLPGWMWLSADEVVDTGLRDLRRGKTVSVPNWKYKTAVFGLKHLPRALTTRVSRDTRGRLGREET
jgi:short-subunit dehydrogenase